jgi:ech hydrogenase subunit A
MNHILFLILFPLLPAALLLVINSEALRKLVVFVSTALLAGVSVSLAMLYTGKPVFFEAPAFMGHHYNHIIGFADIIVALCFLWFCRKITLKLAFVPVLVIIQYGAVLFFDFTGKMPAAQHPFFVDNLSIIMALVISVVGGLIAVYTPSYFIKYHEEHKDFKDRRKMFAAAVFLFFSAMFGIVFSNELTGIYMFWEVTTMCSFLMIGYTQTNEAVRNSFRALWMLLLGGLGFAVAIIYCAKELGTTELSVLMDLKNPKVIFPVVLLCFAGMNKAALFPFSSWLLGAMVAPTPSSALLHSSTMVKAGVYLVLKCAPVLTGTSPGTALAFVGALTFVGASAIAVTERDSKKVLAYSTVANLGLIAVCGCVGTAPALWAAVMLIIFHAASKALLFCCVGVVDYSLESRDIEDMHGLMAKMPFMMALTVVGIAGMFLAPFGMLISKWAVLEAFARLNPLIPAAVIFGGSLMCYFWTKWMGTLLSGGEGAENKERHVTADIWFALSGLALIALAMCALFPLVSKYFIEPMYGMTPVLKRSNLLIIFIMLGMVLLAPLGLLLHRRKVGGEVFAKPYLAGANVADRHSFTGSLGVRQWTVGNYYFKRVFASGGMVFAMNTAAALIIILSLIFTGGNC